MGDKFPTRPSMCHPWSSGVTAWMTKSMLGVTPLRPGYAAYLATPHLPVQHVDYVRAPGGGGDAVFTLRGAVPTPRGAVSVDAASTVSAAGAGAAAVRRVAISVDAPSPGVVGLRTRDDAGCALRADAVSVDGRAAAAGPLRGAAAAVMHPLAADLHTFATVPPGRHTVTAEYDAAGSGADAASCASALAAAAVAPRGGGTASATGAGPFPPYPPASYAASVDPLDTRTRGEWKGKYGGDGYILFAFNSGTADVEKLPGYVRGVTEYKGNKWKRTRYGADEGNATYLRAPGGSGRALGSIGEGCTDGCQGTVLNVNVTGTHPYLLSLYMVDAPGSDGSISSDRDIPRSAEQVIRTMDLDTLSPVAPEAQSHITDFDGGVYWTLRYDRGVRIRIMPLFGSARVSALFWDSVPGPALPTPPPPPPSADGVVLYEKGGGGQLFVPKASFAANANRGGALAWDVCGGGDFDNGHALWAQGVGSSVGSFKINGDWALRTSAKCGLHYAYDPLPVSSKTYSSADGVTSFDDEAYFEQA